MARVSPDPATNGGPGEGPVASWCPKIACRRNGWTGLLGSKGRPEPFPESAAELGPILQACVSEGRPPTTEEVEALFRARGDQVDAVAHVADILRERVAGDTVTDVVNRNIDYNDLLLFPAVGFVPSPKGPRSLNLRGAAPTSWDWMRSWSERSRRGGEVRPK